MSNTWFSIVRDPALIGSSLDFETQLSSRLDLDELHMFSMKGKTILILHFLLLSFQYYGTSGIIKEDEESPSCSKIGS